MVAKAGIPADKEFQFCEEKIQKNFSNYSSWHYRSQLLPLLHPHETDPARPISEAKLKEELELVITAAFTDPNDSSAWFYQRWLLGYSDPKLDLAAVKISKDQAIVSFTKAVDLTRDGITINVDSVPELNAGTWRTISGTRSDAIWIQRGQFQVRDEVKVTMQHGYKEFHLKARLHDNGSVIGIKCPVFGYDFGLTVMDELRNQLDSCNQLLEYEPDSKWTLLTASLLMRSIDRFHYHDTTLEFLKKLQEVDSLRAGYYKDLASKWTVEVQLKNWIDAEGYVDGKADLSGLDLTTLYYHQYYAIASEVNLQDNPKLNRKSCQFSLVDGCDVKF